MVKTPAGSAAADPVADLPEAVAHGVPGELLPRSDEF
jgi:hypothetical protein